MVSDYYNHKALFSLVLLALVDAEYKLLLVNIGLSGSSSNTQNFNKSKLRKKMENDTLGLPVPEPLEEGGPDLHYFLQGEDVFALMLWMVKAYNRRQLTRRE